MPRFTHLLIHHSVTSPAATVSDLRAMHLARGFQDIGYHYVIERAAPDYTRGHLKAARKTTLAGAHAGVSGWNAKALGLCVVGTFHPGLPHSEGLPPESPLYGDVLAAVLHVCRKFRIPAAHVLGHRDVKATACPGEWFPLAALKRDVAAALGGA
jgi:N-acetylmuramoyl-L-alanine amidase